MAPELKLDLDDEDVRRAFALQTPYALEEEVADDAEELDEGSLLDRQIFAGLVSP